MSFSFPLLTALIFQPSTFEESMHSCCHRQVLPSPFNSRGSQHNEEKGPHTLHFLLHLPSATTPRCSIADPHISQWVVSMILPILLVNFFQDGLPWLGRVGQYPGSKISLMSIFNTILIICVLFVCIGIK